MGTILNVLKKVSGRGAEGLDLSKVQRQVRVKAGSIVFSRESTGQVIGVLHEGALVIEQTLNESGDKEKAGATRGGTRKIRIGEIKEKQYFGWESFLPREEEFPIFRARKDSVLSLYPCGKLELFVEKSAEAFVALVRGMNLNFNYFVSFHNKITALVNQLAEANFKFTILFQRLGLRVEEDLLYKYFMMGKLDPEEANGGAHGVAKVGAIPGEEYLELGSFIGRVPDFVAPAKRYNTRDTSIVEMLYERELHAETTAILAKTPKFGVLSFDQLMGEYHWLYKFIYQKTEQLCTEFGQFAGRKDSFLQRLAGSVTTLDLRKWQGILSLAYEHYDEVFFENPFLKDFFNMESVVKAVRIEYGSLGEGFGAFNLGRSVSLEEGGAKGSKRHGAGEEVDEAAEMTEEADSDTGMDVEEFMASEVNDVYKRPVLGKEIKEVMLGNVTSKKDPAALKKIIRNINSVFFLALERAANMRYVNKEASDVADELLRTSVIDARLLHKDHLTEMCSFQDEGQEKYKILTLEKWLERIANEEEVPSNNDLGFDYVRFMRNKHRFLSEKAKKALEGKSEEDKKKDKVSFEVQNMISSVYKMVNYSSGGDTIYPLCQANLVSGDQELSFVTSEMIATMVEEVRSYDFLLFYRESLVQVSETKNQIIMEEVLPQFIVIPAFGREVIFWQEIVGMNKKTPARFIIPWVFSGNFRKSFILACGNFRWELNRTVKGISWMNPLDGGFTGEFVDYLTFYKKNSNLSFENKEKVTRFIRSNRNNPKKMFAILYHEWLEFERKGLLRLNNEERRIFFRYVPFGKEIREELARLPAYQELIRKHDNIFSRDLERFTKFYHHLRDEEGNFPEKVQKYLDVLTF